MKEIANRYQRESVELLDQNKFREAAAKLRLASDECSKDGDDQRAKLFFAQQYFFDGLGTYLTIDFTGKFIQTDLLRATELFENAVKSFQEIGEKDAAMMAQAWELFAHGLIDESNQSFGSAKKHYEDARSIFKQLDPNPIVDLGLKMVQMSFFSACTGEVMMNRSSSFEIGEVKKDFDLLKKENPAAKDAYEAQFAFIKALNYFFDGLNAVKRWDYDNADKRFADSESAVANLKIEIPSNNPAKGMQEVIAPLRLANAAGKKEAEGLKLLLEDKNYKRASKAMIEAAEGYLKAKDGFGDARWTSLRDMDDLVETTRRRAHAISEAGLEDLKEATVGVGKWFVAFFLGTLVLLIWLNTYLKVGGEVILGYSLLAGALGGFGLKFPAIAKAVAELRGAVSVQE